MALFKLPVDTGSSRKVIILIALVLLVFTGMKTFQRYMDASVVKRDDANTVYESADETEPHVEAASMLYPSVWDDLPLLERKQKNRDVIGELGDVLTKTVEWLKGEDGKKVLANPLGRDLWHHDNLVREPSQWRMKPAHVYGELVDMTMVEYPQNPQGLRKLYLITLFDEYDFNYFRILTPKIPKDATVHVDASDKDRGVTGDYLAGDCIFLMSYSYSTQKGYRQAPLFYAPKLYPAREGATPQPLYSPLPQEGKPVAVQQPLNKINFLDMNFVRSLMYYPSKTGDSNPLFRSMAGDIRSEKNALGHIFEYLWGIDQKEIDRKAKNPEINYVTLMAGESAPNWMHGQMTQVRGVVMSLDTLRFPKSTDGMDHIYLLTVGDLGYKEFDEYTWVLATLNLPPELRRGDQVLGKGVFYKLYPYKTKGGVWHWSPLLVCRGVEKLRVPPSPLIPAWIPEEAFPWIVGIAGVLLVGTLFYLYRVSQMDSEKLEQMRQRAQKRRLDAMGTPVPRGLKKKVGKKKGRKNLTSENPVDPSAENLDKAQTCGADKPAADSEDKLGINSVDGSDDGA